MEGGGGVEGGTGRRKVEGVGFERGRERRTGGRKRCFL